MRQLKQTLCPPLNQAPGDLIPSNGNIHPDQRILQCDPQSQSPYTYSVTDSKSGQILYFCAQELYGPEIIRGYGSNLWETFQYQTPSNVFCLNNSQCITQVLPSNSFEGPRAALTGNCSL